MLDESSFSAFIVRIRAGDEQATADLVKRYEPEIRREVRLRLRDPRLRRDFDSMDICQSVLASFFLRAAAGQFDLEQPDQLLKLLVAMARNKLAAQGRSQRRVRPPTSCSRWPSEAIRNLKAAPLFSLWKMIKLQSY